MGRRGKKNKGLAAAETCDGDEWGGYLSFEHLERPDNNCQSSSY